jgi:hypothetical protein
VRQGHPLTVILRFAALRPAPAPSVLSLESGSAFQNEVREAIEDGEPERLDDLAGDLRESHFVSHAEDVAHGAELLELLARLRESGVPDPDDLAELVRETVAVDTPDGFADDRARARDSVLAAYLLDDDTSAGVALELVRAFEIAASALVDHPDRARIETMLRGAVALPRFLTRPTTTDDDAPSPEEVARYLADQVDALSARYDRLTAALGELGMHAEDELEVSETGTRALLSDLYRSAGDREAGGREPDERRPSTGEPAWEPARSVLLRASARRNVVLSGRALDVIPDSVLETVRGLDLDPAETAVGPLQAELSKAQGETRTQLLHLAGQFGELVRINPKLPPIFLDPRWVLGPVDAPDAPPPLAVTAPGATPTPVRPLGIADLLLVRSHIARYERSEVAAIENVLPHEKLTHTVRRLDATETTATDETERTDLRSLTQSTAEQDSGHTTVQAVGPGVGPLAAEGPTSFARTVTDQVSSTSTARTRRQLVERRLRETEETTEHLVENATNQPVYGVYQWLDKIYEARTFSYGTRLLYDVIVPEPAALFREALGRPRSGLPLPVRPAPFTLKPDDLTSFNWAYYATGHHATGVDAPPPEQVVVSEPFGKQAKDPFATDAATRTLTWAEARTSRIPKGYRATRYAAVIMSSSYEAGFVSVSVGSHSLRIAPANGLFRRTGRLDGERESIPIAVEVTSNGVDPGVSDITVAIEIICEAADELMGAWQVKAHGQILDANRRRFEEYSEAVATRDATARLTLQAMPAGRKAGIVSTEVKRTTLAFLTGQSFAGFNATALDAAGFPYPHAAATGALAPYIRFLEQAIEWNHLAYAFMPYFWGAQTSWVAKVVSTEPDRLFGDFLTSGAARVVLPVRRGFEAAFERFLNKGVVPTTEELLEVGGPLWVSLAEELRGQAAPEGEETPVGEPWEFRIATDLLRARADGSMPKWTLHEGAWTDAPDPAF